MRSRSGQRYSPSSLGDSRVLATARHTQVCLRVAVLRDSPKPRRFRSAAAPIVTALATLVEFGAARGYRADRTSSSSLPLACAPLPRLPLAICGAMRRRRDTAFLASLAPGGAIREPQFAVSLSSSSSALPHLSHIPFLIRLAIWHACDFFLLATEMRVAGGRRRPGSRPADVMSDLSAACITMHFGQCRESRASRAQRAESTHSAGRAARTKPTRQSDL